MGNVESSSRLTAAYDALLPKLANFLVSFRWRKGWPTEFHSSCLCGGYSLCLTLMDILTFDLAT